MLGREIMRSRLLSIGLVCITLTTCSKSEPLLPPTAPSSSAGFSVSGQVYEQLPNKARGAALVGVRIELRGTKTPVIAATDQEGHFSLSGLAGTIDLALSKDGYEPNIVSLGTVQRDLEVRVIERERVELLVRRFFRQHQAELRLIVETAGSGPFDAVILTLRSSRSTAAHK